jgi:hypothetical protein
MSSLEHFLSLYKVFLFFFCVYFKNYLDVIIHHKAIISDKSTLKTLDRVTPTVWLFPIIDKLASS